MVNGNNTLEFLEISTWQKWPVKNRVYCRSGMALPLGKNISVAF